MGRSPRLTRAVADRIVEATRNGATRSAAAAAGPVARSTLYAWIKAGRLRSDSPEGRFVARLDDADAACELTCITIWRAHFPKDWRAVAEFMARRYPQWRRSPQAVEESGPDGDDDAVKNTDDEIARQLADDLRKYLDEGETKDTPAYMRGLDDPPVPTPATDRRGT